MLDSLYAKCFSHLAFTCPRTADQFDIVGTVYKISTMELTDEGFIHLAGCKVEHGQILAGREPGSLDVVSDRSDLAFGHLRLEQLLEDRHRRFERWGTLFDQVADGASHALHIEAA